MFTPQDCLFLIAALVIAGFLLKVIAAEVAGVSFVWANDFFKWGPLP